MKKKSASNKVLISSIIFIVTFALLIGVIYYFYFFPKIEVKDIDSTVNLTSKDIISKFSPKDVNISSKEIAVFASTKFTEDELTDLFLLSLQEMPEVKKYVKGIKVDIDNNLINLYANINYNNIPLEANLIFQGKAENGKGVFHYKEGKVGFFNISKEMIFSNLQDNSIMKINKTNGDIILGIEYVNLLKITDITVNNDSIEISFKGSLKFSK